MDWYPWYPDLHDADAGHLTCLEDGAYRRLIDRYMRTRMPLPDDDKVLARFVGLTPDEWAAIAPNVRPFFKPRDGKLHHKRCNFVLEAQDKKTKSHSEHASHAAKSRWAKELKGKENNAQGMPNECDQHAESNADSMLDKCAPDAEGNAQSMLKNARGEEKEKRREEKRREESYTPPESTSPARAPATLAPGRGGVEGKESKLSAEQKLLVVDEIFPGAGAVITNLARFGDWERWNYDWDLDVEPTLREIAESQVPGWMPGGLLYFDKPIARRYHARIAGLTAHPRRAVIQARELSVAEKRAYLENWGLTRAGSAEVNARIKAEGLAERWHT